MRGANAREMSTKIPARECLSRLTTPALPYPVVFRGQSYPLRAMRLDQLIPGSQAGARDVEVTDLAYDKRAVEPGSLFFCVAGFTRDGHEFATDAIGRGAVALVVERPL